MRFVVRRWMLGVCVLSLVACARSAAQPSSGAPPGAVAESRAPKVLTIATQTELKGFLIDYTGESKGIGGVSQPPPIVQNYLVADDGMGVFPPQLAVDKPAVDKGTWIVHPDGRMQTDWKLRPNIKWHDGTPFTAEDLVFSATVCRDPDVACVSKSNIRAMESLVAADPQTLVIHWSAPYANADQAEGLAPLPRHLLEELYRGDKTTFAQSPRFSTEFIGLGPYKLVHWEPGSHIEFARFDEYYMGRPPLDQVIVKFLADTNTMVAAILAGAVDVVLPLGVSIEQGLEVKERWQGTGNQVMFGPSTTLYSLYFQQRPDIARPTNGTVNPAVRRGIYHAIDRAQIIEAGLAGVPPVADSWVPTTDPLRPQLDSAIPQYPHDPTRAQAALAEGGWTRGVDGRLLHQAAGQPFEIEISGAPRQDTQRMQAVMREQLKNVGIEATIFNFPPQLASDNQTRATRPGVTINGTGSSGFFVNTVHTRGVPGPDNRWGGSNWGGYTNQRVDAILDKLVATIPPAERVPLQREVLQSVLGDAALAPLYWNVSPVLALEPVKGIPTGGGSAQTWQMFEWDKR
jgi:peptide/nickel transport system substrate-binding protein